MNPPRWESQRRLSQHSANALGDIVYVGCPRLPRGNQGRRGRWSSQAKRERVYAPQPARSSPSESSTADGHDKRGRQGKGWCSLRLPAQEELNDIMTDEQYRNSSGRSNDEKELPWPPVSRDRSDTRRRVFTDQRYIRGLVASTGGTRSGASSALSVKLPIRSPKRSIREESVRRASRAASADVPDCGEAGIRLE